MGPLIALPTDDTPYVPSAPVQIGTSGPRHGVPEVGSWQALIMMLAAAIVLGTVVLMFAVRQRMRVLERRRVRRMAEAAAAMGQYESLTELGGVTLAPSGATHPRATAHHTSHHTRHAKPRSPERVP